MGSLRRMSCRIFGWSTVAILFLCPAACPVGAEEGQETAPPRAQWIVVGSVDEEYDYVSKQRCRCGGRLEVSQQSLRHVGDARCDVLDCRCSSCNTPKQFYFDVTALFDQMELALSKSAEADVCAELDRQYPQVTPEQIPELKKLLRDSNPHRRTWAAKQLGRLATPEAAEILLDGYLQADILAQMPFEDGLEQMGQTGLQAIGKRLAAAGTDVEACFNLLALLDRFRDPQAARLVEGQLREALESSAKRKLRRICYIDLGQLGFKESMPLLLEAEREEAPTGDEALIWAIARCGGPEGIPILRKYLPASDLRVQAAAVAGLGIAGDREAIPRLMELARTSKEPDLRHNAIYALGRLKAAEAVPVLLELLRPEPHYGAFFSPAGLFGEEDAYTNEACTQACIIALGRIGDRRAIPEFRRLLQDDRHYLDHEDVAQVAADLGWRELTDEVIDRFEKDCEQNPPASDGDRERYAPSLRKLTGQSFGEDPQLWRAWQKSR